MTRTTKEVGTMTHALVHGEPMVGVLRDQFYRYGAGERLWREALSGAEIAARIAPTAGVDEREAFPGALGRDAGKLLWPAFMFDQAQFGAEGTQAVREHVDLTVTMLSALPLWASERNILAAVLAHHERWDGRGYPGRVRGRAIPLLGRVVKAADALSAMTRDRACGRALSWDEAVSGVRADAGWQFDPEAYVWAGSACRCHAVPGL
jgi:HD-GYP domain-containing protein (c-di-GMP phosphodiesterase class II)